MKNIKVDCNKTLKTSFESPEQKDARVNETIRRHKIAAKYGISLTSFDDSSLELSKAEKKQYDSDVLSFLDYLYRGVEPPEELKLRLLEVKKRMDAIKEMKGYKV